MNKGLVRGAFLLSSLLLAAPAWAASTLTLISNGGPPTTYSDSQSGAFTYSPLSSGSSGATGVILNFSETNPTHFVSLDFLPPGGQTLGVGIYDGVQHAGSQSPPQPALSVQVDGAFCNSISGRFVVRAITRNGSTITSLAVDFQQNCLSSSGVITSTVTGSLRFNVDPNLFPIPYPEPTADAGPSQSVLQETPVTLDGSLSDGGSGINVTYNWIQIANGAPTVSLSGENTAKAGFTAPDVGLGGSDLVFQLEVDSTTGTSTNQVTVHVRNPADPVTLLTMTADPPGSIVLTGSANFDPTNASFTIANLSAFSNFGPGVQITVNGGPGVGHSYTLKFAAPKGQTLQAGTVYDLVQDYGTVSTAGPAALNVGGICNFIDGRFVVLDVQTDPSNHITGFAADFEQHCQQEVPALRGKIRFNSAAPLTEPFASAGLPQTLEQGSVVTLTAGDSQAGDGAGITSYQWTQISGPSVTLSDSTAASPSFTAPSVSAGGADMMFQLTVTNSDGLTSTDTVTVHVAAPGDPRTLFYAASDPGDTVGGGMVTYYSGVLVDFAVSTLLKSSFHGVQFLVQPHGLEEWFAYFSMPGTQALQTGTYNFATPYPNGATQALPGMSVWEPIHSCSSVVSNFKVLDVQLSGNNVTSFAADFEQHCKGAAPALRGKLRYNSTMEADDPLAEAGQPQRVTQGATVGLSAAGSDPGAPGVTLTGYQWTQLSGVSATLSDATSPNPSFTAPSVPLGGSDLVFQLTVTNSLGLTGSSQVTVRVVNPSDPPIVTLLHMDSDAGDPVGGGQTIDMDTSGFNFLQSLVAATGGGINSVNVSLNPLNNGSADHWTLKFAAPSTAALQGGKTYGPAQTGSAVLPDIELSDSASAGCIRDTAHFSVLDLQQDPYGKITSAALDFEQHCAGATGSLHGKYRYNSDVPMDAPFADAGPAQGVLQEATVQLTGHASYSGSPSDTISSYQWTQLSGPSVVLSDPTQPDPTFSAPDVSPGGADLSFQLTVVNSEGLSASDTVNIHVANPADPVTAVRITGDPGDWVSQGKTWNEDGVIAGFVPNKDSVGVSIDVKGGVYGDWSIFLAAPQGQKLQAMTYADAEGLSVRTPGAPQMDISGNGRGCTFILGNFVVKQVDIGTDGTLNSFAADFDMHCEGNPAGLRGKIRYNSTFPIDDPVAITAPAQAVVQGDTVTLDGSATDPGGDGSTITSWQWTQVANGAPTVTLYGADTATASFVPGDVPLGGETLVFLLTVTNSLGLTSTEEVTVKVANPGDPQTGIYLEGAPDFGSDDRVQTLLRPLDGVFSATTPSSNAVTVTYTSVTDSFWHLTFVPPKGKPFQVGTYTDVSNAAASGVSDDDRIGSTPGSQAQMLVTDQDFNDVCQRISGQFTVEQVSYDGNGNVTAFAADFKQTCSDSFASWRILRGEVRYNSTVSLREPLADPGSDQAVFGGFAGALDGSLSSTPFGTLTAYQWTQVVGSGDPTVKLVNAATAKPSFTLPNLTTGRILSFQLTVTNSLGLTSTDTVHVQLVGQGDPKTGFYYQSDADDPDGHGATVLATAADAEFDASSWGGGVDADAFSNGQTSFDQNWEFAFSTAGQTLQKGLYPSDDIGGPHLLATDGACDQTGGVLLVRDVSYGKAGVLASLAVDFVRRCQGATGALRGAFRYNSSTPIKVDEPGAYAGAAQRFDAPGTVTLDGSLSFPGWGKATYAWKQVAGPAVSIIHPASAIAQFVLPAAVLTRSGNTFKFALTVTSASGKSSTATTTVTAKLSDISLLHLTSDAGDPIGGGQVWSLDAPAASFHGSTAATGGVQVLATQTGGNWAAGFRAPAGQQLAVGTYNGATKYANAAGSSAQMFVDLIKARAPNCHVVSGSFTVLDVQYGGQRGALSSLAVDFDQTCDGASGALHGKLRYQSAIP